MKPIYQDDPTTISTLIHDIEKYLSEHNHLTKNQLELLDHVVGGLGVIVAGLPLNPFDQ